MATSANTLSQIISTLCTEYDLDEKQVLKQLETKDLLPAKLIKKNVPKKTVSLYASKQAEELATQANLVVAFGEGSGKDGKHTLTDIKQAIEVPKAKKINISPTALNYANDNGLIVANYTGTGKDGRIVLKDLQISESTKTKSDTESGSESESE